MKREQTLALEISVEGNTYQHSHIHIGREPETGGRESYWYILQGVMTQKQVELEFGINVRDDLFIY